jgi:protein phosphatase PTC7
MQGRKRNGTGKVSDDVHVRGREATNSNRILEKHIRRIYHDCATECLDARRDEPKDRTMINASGIIMETVLNAVDHAACACCLPSTLQEDGAATVSQPTTPEETDGQDDYSSDEAEAEEEEDEIDDTSVPALRMDCASCYLPDHGEDAHFMDPDAGVVGVADGVGSYRDMGVDASAFARALMKHASSGARRAGTKAKRHHSQSKGRKHVTPYRLLDTAYTKSVRSGTPGASTALIVSLRGATLEWAFVGDSAFAVLRGGKVVHRSALQRKRFNKPYQLRTNGRVSDADVGKVAVAEGDVVVVGTDGLFDNVFDVDLEQVVQEGMERGVSPQKMAQRIAAVKEEMSRSWFGRTPFTVECARAVGDGVVPLSGGKVDDTTVVVAYIVPKDS